MIIKSTEASFDESNQVKSKQQTSSSTILAPGEYFATEYYINFCLSKEEHYNRMRVNPPKFFYNALDYINQMESSNMCDSIYVGNFSYLQPLCKKALNGILNKGLTNTFYHMFTQILKANLQFEALGATSLRNRSTLLGEL